ncbi:MAG: hypothetical protein C0505_17285 [Leptothrix sp. (in: Bacteria)]|nr:hypothetical protein [Leptothrix sp. (in: b-proteobacteria)]
MTRPRAAASATGRGLRGLAALAVAGLQASCIVVPQTREVYDPECRVLTRQVTLEAAVIGSFQSCAGDACAAMLVTMGAVTAASAVVSGSIALVGNVAYWFERQGRCLRPAAAAVPALPASTPAS